MKKNNEESIMDIISKLRDIDYINPEDIPNIDLYMDQVTTFMDARLASCKRSDDDKILTKTMINNYAKNDLLPPPVKKKYSKEHVLLLIFIYYYKNILSITDIQTLLKPITEQYFGTEEELNLEAVYNEVFALQEKQVERLKKDVFRKFEDAEASFEGAPDEKKEFLHKFAFICYLSFDVYVKKLLIEKVIDSFSQEEGEKSGRTKDRK